MWICVKSINREINGVGVADSKSEILDIMYADMCNELGSEGDLHTAAADEKVEINSNTMTAWSNYRNINKDWKCFLV